MSPSATADLRDAVRQVATLVGAVTQAALPLVLLPRAARDVRPPDVAQPAPWAFAIWLPIYAASAVYAVDQARPSRRADPVLRRVGRPLAGAFLCLGAWAPLLYRRRYWPAQAALAGAALLAGTARTRLTREDPAAVPRPLALSSGLLAGWGVTACGVNLASMLVGVGPVRPGTPTVVTGVGTSLALGAVAWATVPRRPTSLTQRSYAAALLWALAGVAAGKYRTTPAVGVSAALAAVPLIRRVL